jgi:surfeit locus 1 family protein
VLVVLVTFSAAGVWQLRRAEQREAQSAVVGARMTAAPLTLAEARALAADDGEAAAGVHPLAYRRVRLEGTFDASAEVLKRPVARDGTPGYHVVTPLVVEGGSAVLVERGWVPQTHGEVPVTDAAPPAGRLVVEGWAFPPERPPTGFLAGLAPRDPPEGRLTTVAYLDVVRLASQVPYPLEPLTVLVDAPERAPGDVALPLPPPSPELGPGPHLGYAVQWFSFVLITLIGYAALLRRVSGSARSGA